MRYFRTFGFLMALCSCCVYIFGYLAGEPDVFQPTGDAMNKKKKSLFIPYNGSPKFKVGS